MERVQFIEHKGRKMLHLNFADRAAAEVLAVIEQAKAAIRTQPAANGLHAHGRYQYGLQQQGVRGHEGVRDPQ